MIGEDSGTFDVCRQVVLEPVKARSWLRPCVRCIFEKAMNCDNAREHKLVSRVARMLRGLCMIHTQHLAVHACYLQALGGGLEDVANPSWHNPHELVVQSAIKR